MVDICALDKRALDVALSVINRVDASQLNAPTPCAKWTLRQLLAHMIGQNHGIAAVARGETKDRGVWAPRPVGSDPAGQFAESAALVDVAFAEAGVLERGFWLPEIRDGGLFPAPMAITTHVMDYVVHTWDVARAIGIQPQFDGPDDTELLNNVLATARRVPDGPGRQRDNSAFRPCLEIDPDAPILDHIVARLGRSPQWPARPPQPHWTDNGFAATPTGGVPVAQQSG